MAPCIKGEGMLTEEEDEYDISIRATESWMGEGGENTLSEDQSTPADLNLKISYHNLKQRSPELEY